MNEFFDTATVSHLDAWLDAQMNGDEYRAKVREQMLSFAADDPEYWSSQSWWNLFDRSDCRTIERE